MSTINVLVSVWIFPLLCILMILDKTDMLKLLNFYLIIKTIIEIWFDCVFEELCFKKYFLEINFGDLF